jgi:hypothetical protein
VEKAGQAEQAHDSDPATSWPALLSENVTDPPLEVSRTFSGREASR